MIKIMAEDSLYINECVMHIQYVGKYVANWLTNMAIHP